MSAVSLEPYVVNTLMQFIYCRNINVMSSSNTSNLGSPRLGDRPSRHNRMTVVVEQKMVKVPMSIVKNPQSKEPACSPSLDPSIWNLVDSASKLSSEVLQTSLIDYQPPMISSPDSVTSSCSSLVDTVSNVSSGLPPSSESRILESLQHQISQTAMKMYQLEREIQDIPKLQCEVDWLEKERAKLANDLLDSQELVKTMKQRISVLHEQNEQLVQLTTGERTDSSEVMRMRNTLVASLAQLKQLQKQVDTIPALKAQLRLITDENTKLKEFDPARVKPDSAGLPQSISLVDYQAVLKENEELKQINARHLQSFAHLNGQLHTITTTCDELKWQIEKHNSSTPVIALLQEQIKTLESEKDCFHHQALELKLRNSIMYADVDTAYLTTEVSELKKKNSQLKSQLNHQMVESQQQKEELIVKLFELERLKVMSEQQELKGEIQKVHGNVSSELTDSQEEFRALTESLPAVKQQLLKLDQLKLCYEQSRQIVHSTIAENKELEKRVNVLVTRLEKHEVTELERLISEKESKLKIATQRIGHLEQQLSHFSNTNSEFASVVSENERLTKKLTELQVYYEQSLEVIRDLRRIEEQQKHYETLQITFKKAKEDKRKAEKKYKFVSEKLQSLAKELSSSTELLKNYQTQCAQLQSELESSLAENNSVRNEVATLKADVEVARFERDSHSKLESIKVCELQHLCKKLSSENTKLEDNLKKVTLELQKQLEAVKYENSMLTSESMNMKTMLEKGLSELEKKSVESETLQERLNKIEGLLDSTSEAKKQLELELETLKDHSTNELLLSEEAKHKETLSHTATKEKLQKSEQLVLELQSNNEGLLQENQSLTLAVDKLKQCLVSKDRELDSWRVESEALAVASTAEIERLSNQLKQSEAYTDSHIASLTQEKAELLSKLQHIEELSQVTQLESKLQKVNKELEMLHKARRSGKAELDKLRQESSALTGEVEGYKAMVDSLHRRLEEAETREIEHEQLRLKIKKLERLLGDSSHDNKTLVKLLHETVTELPTYSTRSLQDENLKLEEQVSVLSQWNDKQRDEIEELEKQTIHLQNEKHQLLLDLTTKEGHMQENLQLKRELKEVEMEINMLRRQVRADIQEELHMKIDAQTQLLSVFSQHNDSLRIQVEQLQKQVLSLGGKLEKHTPASPPPVPDMSIFAMPSEEMRQRTWSDLGRENLILKQRIKTMEEEVRKLHSMSSSVRRRSTTLHALSSVPVCAIHEELQIK